ncbi:MAG: DUF2946 family protein [Bacteroidales bacterium]
MLPAIEATTPARHARRSSPRRSPWRLPTAWLGILLVAFNLLAGSVGPTTAAPTAADGLIVVCTVGGMRMVDPAAAPGDTQLPASAADGLCVFCLPLVHAGSAAVADEFRAMPPTVTVVARAPFSVHDAPVATRRHSPHASRAPPAHA